MAGNSVVHAVAPMVQWSTRLTLNQETPVRIRVGAAMPVLFNLAFRSIAPVSWQKAPWMLGEVSPTLLWAKADTISLLVFAASPSCSPRQCCCLAVCATDWQS